MTKRHKTPTRLELSRVDPNGLDLTVTEDRALTAVQILLDKNTFPDTPRARCENSSGFPTLWPHIGSVPVLRTTWQAYLEAYGLEDGKNSGPARTALKRLAGLEARSQPFNVRIERREPDHWAALNRLVHLPYPSRRKDLIIIPTPPLWDGIDTAGDAAHPKGAFYTLKENALFPRLFTFLRDQHLLGPNGEFRRSGHLRLLYKILTQGRQEHFSLDREAFRKELRISEDTTPDEVLTFARDFGYLESFEKTARDKWLLRPSTNLAKIKP